MAPNSYTVTLEHRTTGGFIGIHPITQYIIKQGPELEVTVKQNWVKTPVPTGTFRDVKTDHLTPDDTTNALIDELYGILQTLPNPRPKEGDMSVDPYGKQTSIVWKSDDLDWSNNDSGACDPKKTVDVTDDDKKNFVHAVRIVAKLVGKEDTINEEGPGLLKK
ncbi:hypothetical protein C8R47DRAFT_617559 [Mycena vitilis]|nr:hypothetical protein C8R47DRAFT_617559 [Mycena vitilis]